MPPLFPLFQSLTVHTDGAIRPERSLSGLAVIVRDARGHLCYWWSARAGALTCNEAEYAAVILALQNLPRLRPRRILLYSDSQVVVHQMRGLADTHAPALRQARGYARALLTRLPEVTFQHIPREHNRLADALANDVADGLVVEQGHAPAEPKWLAACLGRRGRA